MTDATYLARSIVEFLFSISLLSQTVFDHVALHLHPVLGCIHRKGLAVSIDVVAILAVFDKPEGIIFFDLLHRAPGGVVVVFQSLFGECTHAYEFLVRLRYNKDTSRNHASCKGFRCVLFQLKLEWDIR